MSTTRWVLGLGATKDGGASPGCWRGSTGHTGLEGWGGVQAKGLKRRTWPSLASSLPALTLPHGCTTPSALWPQLSASQRELRLCSRGGPPGVLCTLLHTLLVPQLPAALAPPALLAAAGALLYAAAWLLYNTAALTIPLALWAAFAADGSLALTPAAAAAAAQLLPEAAHPLPLPLPLAHSRGAALLLLPALLLALRLSEAAVLRHRQQRCEAARRAVTTAGVQAHFAGWALPGSGGSGGASPSAQGLDHAVGGAAHHEQQQAALHRQQEAALRREVGQLWQAVYGEGVHADHLQTLQGGQGAAPRVALRVDSAALHLHRGWRVARSCAPLGVLLRDAASSPGAHPTPPCLCLCLCRCCCRRGPAVQGYWRAGSGHGCRLRQRQRRRAAAGLGAADQGGGWGGVTGHSRFCSTRRRLHDNLLPML